MIEADLVAMLKADSAVAALASTRIYPTPPPEGASLPLVTWQQIGDAPTRVADGALNVRQSRYQLNVWAASMLAAVNLSNAVRAAVDEWESSAVQMALTDNVVDLFDGDFAPPRYGRALDVRITHKE